MSENISAATNDLHFVKIGGSLFRLPDWKSRILEWRRRAIDNHPDGVCRFVWMTGGGELADVVRVWDARFELGDAVSHELACQTMALTNRLLRLNFPDWTFTETVPEVIPFVHMNRQVDVILNAGLWAKTKKKIPQNWSVTSDSIAAYALLELVNLCPGTSCALTLLKNLSGSRPRASILELVDPHFTTLAQQLQLAATTINAVDLSDGKADIGGVFSSDLD